MLNQVTRWASAFFLFGLGVLALIGVTTLIWAMWPENWRGQDAAAWVQAVGSIAAIVAGFSIATYQSSSARRLAESIERDRLRRRWSSVKAVVDALYQQCLNVAPHFEGDEDFNSFSFLFVYDKESFTEALRRVDAAPLFELDSDELVRAVTSFRDAVADLHRWIEIGVGRSRFNRRDLDEDEPADWQIKQMGRGWVESVTRQYTKVHAVTGGVFLEEGQWFGHKDFSL